MVKRLTRILRPAGGAACATQCATPVRSARRLAGAITLAVALGFMLIIPLSTSNGTAHAGEAQPMAADPALEARVMVVAEELRCLVCQNETVAASQADLAKDLRAQIRAQLQEGRSAEEVRDFMVARYGQFVLYRPPLQASTWALWVGPFALLAIALLVWVRQMRRGGAARSTPG